ncbi:MAG: mechanosensitive ion channel family protein [Gammaproteobacteria bacterium]|nr:mechanosensitive ion channel family protein [Gammaproteobacteria bacterium]MBU2478493.1 mechanosensitive ion channel family protein [Gammaproteobacteria bacterium]
MEQGILPQLIELFSTEHLLQASMAILLAWLLLHAIRFSLDKLAARFPRYRLQIGQSFPVARILVWSIVTAYIVFGILNPPEEVMFAVLGSIGLAVGLGAQDGIRNLLAGVMMIFNPPYRIGDMIEMAGHYGEVVRIDLSVTWLHTFDDSTIMIPNAEILKQAVVNSNSGELAEMVVVRIDLPATAQVADIKALALDAARCSPYVYLKKPVVVMVESRHDYRHLLRFSIKAYVLDVRLERRMASDITERFYEALQGQSLLTQLPESSTQSAASI